MEAAQHFEDLATFATEAHRVLKPAADLPSRPSSRRTRLPSTICDA
ncbi:MAG: hypothetical protein ACRDRK_09415 [Pseudonocardia sp.]